MADLGWTGILLGEHVGGSNLGLLPALAASERFGRYLLPEPFVATAVIAATVLDGSAGRAEALASSIATGESIVTLAWQEAINQLSFSPVSTTLVRDGGGLALTGHKLFVPAWTKETELVVSCLADGEQALVLVAPDAAGLSVVEKRMADGSVTANLSFDRVPVSDDAVISTGVAAAEVLQRALLRGTIALCAQLEGLAAAALSRTIDYMNQRVQFNQPLAEFQALRHRIVNLYAEVELAGASWREAAALLESEGTHKCRVAVSAAKARCSEAALEVAKTALQYHGAFGYTDESDVGLYLNSAMRLASWLGNPLAHRRNAFRLHRELTNHV